MAQADPHPDPAQAKTAHQAYARAEYIDTPPTFEAAPVAVLSPSPFPQVLDTAPAKAAFPAAHRAYVRAGAQDGPAFVRQSAPESVRLHAQSVGFDFVV